MTPPPIRYPLPMLLALVAAGVLAWQGAGLVRSARDALAARVEAVLKDQVPTEPDPRLTSGPIPARGLLLRDDTVATARPDGGVEETIGKRRIVDILNVWPPRGEPTHYRIGNDRSFGWVPARALLRWDTRLVVRPTGAPIRLADVPGGPPGQAAVAGLVPVPIVAIDEATASVRCQTWTSAAPWSEPGRDGWARLDEIPAESLEALVTHFELVSLIRRLAPKSERGTRDRRALLTLLGRLGDSDPPADADLDRAGQRLKPVLDRAGTVGSTTKDQALFQLNADWQPDATIGVPVRGVPLRLLPAD